MSDKITDAQILSLAYDLNAMPEQMTDAKLYRFALAMLSVGQRKSDERIAALEKENAQLKEDRENLRIIFVGLARELGQGK